MLNKCLCIVINMIAENDSDNIKMLISVYIVTTVTTSLLIYLHSISIALNYLCCLWCSKMIILKLSNICSVKKNICCKCCYKKYKSCKNVCEALRKHCNILILNRFSLSSIYKSTNFLSSLMLSSMRKLLSLYYLSIRRNTLR